MKHHLHESLKEAGWTSQEAIIYTTLLSLGTQPASVVAKRIRRPRVTIYHALERMSEKGMIRKKRTNRCWFYEALSPSEWIKIQQQVHEHSLRMHTLHQETFARIAPALEHMQTVIFQRPSVEVFEGADALRQVYELSFETAEMLAYFAPWPRTHQRQLRDIDDWHTSERVRRRIPVRIMLPDTAEGRNFACVQKPYKQARIIPAADYPFRDITIITDTRMLMYSAEEEVGFCIESKDIAHNQKVVFSMAWQLAQTMKSRE